jgi:hypothetical protein
MNDLASYCGTDMVFVHALGLGWTKRQDSRRNDTDWKRK